jgi:hypothetical protein
MPKGKGHRFSSHEHDIASHIIQTELRRGNSIGRANEIAWGRINKMRKRG